MCSRKSKRVKEIKNYSFLANDDEDNDNDDDFASHATNNKKIKKQATSITSKKAPKINDIKIINTSKQSIVDLLKTETKTRESVVDRVFRQELNLALELSRNSSQESSKKENIDSSNEMPDLTMETFCVQNDFENKDNLFNNNETNSTIKNDFKVSTLILSSINSDVISEVSNVSFNNVLKERGQITNVDADDCKNDSIGKSEIDSRNVQKSKSIAQKSSTAKLKSESNHLTSSQHLSPLQGSLRLGLSRNSRVRSLHQKSLEN